MKTKWRMLAIFAGVVVAMLALGSAAWAAVISNSGSISIPDSGKATPYPATINVSGLTGTITDVNVTLNGVRHTWPDDVSALLVGPGGQNVRLMSDVGGGYDLNGVGLTFDDEAASTLPDNAQITAGTYKPTKGTTSGGPTGSPASLPSPAPAGPYGTSLSAFDGSDPNGTYSLYVYDDTPQDTGEVTGGFSLDIKTTADASVDKLPDLGMMQIRDIRIDNTSGKRLLRFTTRIANGGAGPFDLQGVRTGTSSPWTVNQKIYDSSGGSRNASTPATLTWGGDGHNHWHVNNLQRYELDRSDNGVKVGTGAKAGFCFYDNTQYKLTLPGAPQSSQYVSPPACQPGDQSATQVPMGLSVGWGDRYGWDLPGQYIDVTGLTAGRYRLWATADPDNWFTESNGNNNSTWCDIQLTSKRNGVSVLSCGGYLQ